MMKKLLIIIVLSLGLQSAFAASCRKQLKQDRYKFDRAQVSIDKAVDYYNRHENYIDRRNYTMAKKYIDLAIERINTALKRFEIAETSLNQTLVNCPKKYKRIAPMLETIVEESEELKFQLLICDEISKRL